MDSLSVLIPAHDEAAWMTSCLEALFASTDAPADREVIVIANACRDDTAAQARAQSAAAQQAGWVLTVIETEPPGKLGALNTGDAAAQGALRVYLDADVTVSPGLMAELAAALSVDTPRYATGSPRIARANSGISRAYARFWARLPFVTQGTPGFGLFAMNALGRRQWENWPDIIADDMFARLNFPPNERTRVAAQYDWPPVEGLANLIRVRRRQNAGVAELADRYPGLLRNEDKAPLGLGRLIGLALCDPVGFAAYATVALGVRSPLYRGNARWARGR